MPDYKFEKIIFVSVMDNNVGDIYSSPVKFFDFPVEIIEVAIGNRKKLSKYMSQSNNLYIIGGGGIINTNRKWNNTIHNISTSHPTIFWGGGINTSDIPLVPRKRNKPYLSKLYVNFDKLDITRNKEGKYRWNIPEYFSHFEFYGIRDYLETNNYLPCVSCMIPELIPIKKTNKYIIYQHYKYPITLSEKDSKRNINIISNIIHINNTDTQVNIEKAQYENLKHIINIINSTHVIITNSYHGIYWGMLLNCKVIYVDNHKSLKFKFMKYDVTYYSGNLKKDIKRTQRYPDALQECIDLNTQFYNKVIQFIKT